MSRPARRGAVALLLGSAMLLTIICSAAVATRHAALVVTHGVSMQPVYSQGDLVLVTSQPDYGVGDIVGYRRASHHGLVLHRIVGGDPSGWVFQGDNNASVDPTTPRNGDLVGRAALHIPRGGTWLRRLTCPLALAAYVFLLLAGGTAATTRRRHKERRTVPSPSPRPLATLPDALRPVAATAAAVGLLGACLGAVAWTRPATTAGATLASVDSSLDFSYTATVRESAAYDGTTVRAPQPVFRALTDNVEVTYAYTGRPGEVALDVELSNGSGWRSTVHLSPKRALAAEQDGSVTLDLSALEARADAASAVTGIPAGSLTVTVVPRIWMQGGGQFAPELPLVLDGQRLELASDTALSATTSSRAGSRATVPAQLTALGRSLDVRTARTASAVLLLLALLAAGGLAVAVRRSGPVAEADRIRARHRDLLLPVLPVVLTAGRPVVDVPDMDALAKLAQRYGLLVLHWERGGVTTYVVQDEGTTYRFRSWSALAHEALEPEVV